jgi:hypothetical protein
VRRADADTLWRTHAHAQPASADTPSRGTDPSAVADPRLRPRFADICVAIVAAGAAAAAAAEKPVSRAVALCRRLHALLERTPDASVCYGSGGFLCTLAKLLPQLERALASFLTAHGPASALVGLGVGGAAAAAVPVPELKAEPGAEPGAAHRLKAESGQTSSDDEDL